MHGYFTVRLVDTRPYFLNKDEFGHWYYRIIEILPDSIRPGGLLLVFTVLPVACITFALLWQIRRHGRGGWTVALAADRG